MELPQDTLEYIHDLMLADRRTYSYADVNAFHRAFMLPDFGPFTRSVFLNRR